MRMRVAKTVLCLLSINYNYFNPFRFIFLGDQQKHNIGKNSFKEKYILVENNNPYFFPIIINKIIRCEIKILNVWLDLIICYFRFLV